MDEQIKIKKLDANYFNKMMLLLAQLNPNKESEVLGERLKRALKNDSYKCFGLFKEANLIGLIGCWTFTKLYSGKQLELDNVIIDSDLQSKGYGKLFINFIEDWARNNDYESIGLNAYVENARSHKFYFRQEFKILGFHFQKKLTTK